jgi:hypothetical protein
MLRTSIASRSIFTDSTKVPIFGIAVILRHPEFHLVTLAAWLVVLRWISELRPKDEVDAVLARLKRNAFVALEANPLTSDDLLE